MKESSRLAQLRFLFQFQLVFLIFQINWNWTIYQLELFTFQVRDSIKKTII